MAILLRRPNFAKPVGDEPDYSHPFFCNIRGFWTFGYNGDIRNKINGQRDANSLADSQNVVSTAYGPALRADRSNSGFYQQQLGGLARDYVAPDIWTDVAFIRARDFDNVAGSLNFVCGTTKGALRGAGIWFPTSSNSGDMGYWIDATSDDILNFRSAVPDTNVANWDYGIIAGGSLGNQAFLFFKSCPFGTGIRNEYAESGSNTWGGAVGGETAVIGHRVRSSWNVAGGFDIYWAAHLDRVVSRAELESLAAEPFQFWDTRIWIPVGVGEPGPVALNIDSLTHVRPVDAVDVIEITVDIDIAGLDHARPVDSPLLNPILGLFFQNLNHVRPVDTILIIPTEQVDPADLTHARQVDAVDVTEIVGTPLTVESLTHVRAVDALLLDVEALITIDNLDHARPVDTVDVQPLLGDQTGMGATASAWVLDAGQALTNAASLDFSYHVLEGVFDGSSSVLGVDGARVTGAAGMRELTTLTFGADVDGNRRVEGEIAELRIYAGALSAAERDAILSELQTKWITG